MGASLSDDPLINEILDAEIENIHARQCQVCMALLSIGDSDRYDAVERAIGGTIGAQKLSAILTKNLSTPVGRRAIDRHREEGHTP